MSGTDPAVAPIETRLRAEVEMHRKRTLEAYQANVRIFQLTERIRAAYDSTRLLAGCRTPEDLLARAGAVLTDTAGLDYRGAGVYLLDGNVLQRRHGGEGPPFPARVDLDEEPSHPFARALREEGEIQRGEAGLKALRLRGREGPLGVLAVLEHPDAAGKVWQDNILLTLAGVLSLMLENLFLYERVEAQSLMDSLTQVYNRRYFDQKLRVEMERAGRYGRDVSLIMIDIDRFKEINDRGGHPQGDAVLQMVGRLLEQRSRSIDVVCRFGGDEFAVLLPETPLARASQTAERLRETFAKTFLPALDPGGEPLRPTISCGVAAMRPGSSDAADLIARADRALYRAKTEGRNRVCVDAVTP